MSLFSMFLPSNPFSGSFLLRDDPEAKRKSHSLDFFKSPMYTIVRGLSLSSQILHSHSLQFAAVLVLGAISAPGTIVPSTAANKFVASCFFLSHRHHHVR
jgi:hypothetical protein